MMTEVTDRVRAEWARRVEAEYHSAALTQHLTLLLFQVGASPDLIRAGLRIAEDELVHAELSHATLAAAGGAMTGPLDRDQLGITRWHDEDLETRILLTCLEAFCLGETVAVPLFSALRSQCTAPEARATLDRVLVDEVRHRDFGWTLLQWLLEQPFGDRLRVRAQAVLDGFIRSQAANYADQGEAPMTATETAWGLMHSSRYAEIQARTVRRDYQPRFAALGLDCADPAEGL